MSRLRSLSPRVAGLLLALSLAPALYAQDAPTPVEPHGPAPDNSGVEAVPHDHDHEHAGHGHEGHGHGAAPRGDGVVPDLETKAVLVGELDFSALAGMAIQEGGRKKPLQTYVIETLETIHGRPLVGSQPKFKDPGTGQTLGSMEIFCSLWLHDPSQRDWDDLPFVLVASGALKKEIGLDPKVKHFSKKELVKNQTLEQLRDRAMRKRRANRENALTDLEKEAEIVVQRMHRMTEIQHGGWEINIVPHPTDEKGRWVSVRLLAEMYGSPREAVQYLQQTQLAQDPDHIRKLFTDYAAYEGKVRPVIGNYVKLRNAYLQRDAAQFADAAATLRQSLAHLSPTVYPDYAAMAREIRYNNLRPFGVAWVLYLLAGVLGGIMFRFRNSDSAVATCGTWVTWALFLGGLCVHTYGFVLRCMIAGRPPVSNMYESVIWVGFGSVFFGLIFEVIYRNARYFLISGAIGGFLCLVLMDMVPVLMGNANMAGFESRIGPLVPVLRDNFWLTVHVLTITLSYSAFALAWVLGHVTLGSHLFSPDAKKEHHLLHQFLYRVIQIGVLLLATGTILGGVWAYYSWGRFWGWDPKETWAFIGLLCYLVVLHGRFTGWWGNFGLSVGSVICFQSIVMAWYGVNFVLGSGLHSYGSGTGGFGWVLGAVIFDAIFTVAAVVRHVSHGKAAAPQAEGASAVELNEEMLTATDPITEEKEITGGTPAPSSGD